MQLILSTHNSSKAAQVKAIFAQGGIEVLTLGEAGIDGKAVEGDQSLEENSRIKARFAHKAAPGVWVAADDTGIFITALAAAPGVQSARWAGEGATTSEITQYCLDRLKGNQDRSATFRSVVVLISPSGEESLFTGEIHGHLLEAPKVPPQPDMPYSPLFVPDGYDLCWAEMSLELENEISHRGQAFRKALEYLRQLELTN